MNGINTLIGHSVFEEIRNDHITIYSGEQSNMFYGTINQKQIASDSIPFAPTNTIRIIDYQNKPRSFKKIVQKCDVFIIDILTAGVDFNEIDLVVKIIKSLPESHQQEKIVILISTVMTWICTPKKFIEKYEESSDEEMNITSDRNLNKDLATEDDIQVQRQYKQSSKLKQKFVVYEPFVDKDFQNRVPPPRYQQHKNVENLLMTAQKSNKSLRCHVLCSGIPYGKGEMNEVFYDFYRRSWLSLHKKLATLPVAGDGKNILPILHVQDLARSVKQLIINKYQQQYFIIKDNSKFTQKQIVKTISKALGCGKLKNFDVSLLMDEDWSEFLSVDLDIQPSRIFMEQETWHCKSGISSQSIQMLVNEFNTYRGLFPLKIHINGPPASGKSHYAKLLSQKYGIPHIKVSDLIELCGSLDDELGQQIKKTMEEQKDKIVADYEKTKKKKDPELDRSNIKVRIPDYYLYQLLKIKLQQSACKNKGYILDGFPRNFQNATELYLRRIEDYDPSQFDNDSLQLDPFPGFDVKINHLPQYIIILEGDDVQLKSRIKQIIPADQLNSTHYNDQGMDRRLKLYRDSTNEATGNTLISFFSKLLPLDRIRRLNCFDLEDSLTNEMSKLIEKDGKPCCLNLINEKDLQYLKRKEKKKKRKQLENDGKLEELEEEKSEEELDLLTQNMKKEEQEMMQREQEEKQRQEQMRQERQQQKQVRLKEQEQVQQARLNEIDVLDKRTLPIRQYLMDNIVSHVMQGLVELCHKVPVDPVDFLADYLLLKADEIDQQRLIEREADVQTKGHNKQKRRR
ncbi:dpy-30 motif family protein [Stylonychia lemnae]|uniref:Dpy-30 motif family protein n=1 Tax=Stylonychia lemnae TaxID=5949 RepID=A0A078AFR0_STYLE|nr:dpy-30 motif family protein [Stylonychia lemnae]|eukprot:CDW80676.1 dpy-30 motif family protein [Stylonychia lemnae]